MRIDDSITIERPKSAQGLSRLRNNVWIRHAIMRAIWEIRNRHLVSGFDIFNVYSDDECVVVNIRGNIEACVVSESKVTTTKKMVRNRKGRNRKK